MVILQAHLLQYYAHAFFPIGWQNYGKLRAAAYVLDGENLRQLFEKLDVHKDGYLPCERFKQVIKSIFPMKIEELNAVYKL